jgi:hypothetical protein
MALPQMQITDGTNTINITDNGVSDGSPYAGILTYTGQIGVFDITTDSGTTKPHDGSAAVPTMHLGVYGSASGTGTLTVKFTETDFGPMANSLTGFVSHLGGYNAGPNQSLAVYYDTANTAFGTTGSTAVKIADLTTIGTKAFFAGIPANSPFSLTMVSTMSLNDSQTGSLDMAVAPVPEPATMLLLGTGLAGIAGLRRRKNKKA